MLVYFCILALRLKHVSLNAVISKNKIVFLQGSLTKQNIVTTQIERKTSLWIQNTTLLPIGNQ